MTHVNRHILRALNVMLGEDNLVVIRNEGGLASQIAFWALGHEFTQLGFNVKFDNYWFKSHGLDIDGRFSRNFDFPKAFPDLEFTEASPFERFVLRKLNNVREGNLDHIATPVYLGGFYDGGSYDRWKLVQKYQRYLFEKFDPRKEYFSERDLEILKELRQDENTCGVHVRRGDLANDHEHYGKSVGQDYFFQAIEKIRALNGNTRFYFFSDEPDWIKSNIANRLGPEVPHVVIDENGSDRGFVDLYLMSRCRSFISSQGAFAKYARILGDPTRLIIEPSSRARFDEKDANVIVLQV